MRPECPAGQRRKLLKSASSACVGSDAVELRLRSALVSDPEFRPSELVIKGQSLQASREQALSSDSNLVDPASSHMLVSKIKPCMSKYKLLYGETANGSLKQL